MIDPALRFEPSLAAYVQYCVGFVFRYFLLAGGIYWIFHVAFRQRWANWRIQPVFPEGSQIRREIRWTMLNTLCSGFSTLLLYTLVYGGYTRMYFDIGNRGWAYLVFSALLGLVAYDTWFYWQHRLLHTRWLFRHAHSVHHRSSNPSAFGGYAHHPIETFMGNAFFVLFPLVVPVHPLAFAAFGGFLLLVALWAHAGYEVFPSGFTRHPLFRWLGTATHHNLHHSSAGHNFGIVFNYWDRWMGTNHPAYHELFEQVTRRRMSGPAVTV